jgi:hypothetical protein
MSYTWSRDAQRQREQAALRHGGRSQVLARRRSGYVKQSILQPLGLRYADLSQIAKRYLDLYARVVAKIEMYDAHAAEYGFLDAEGNSPPWIVQYYAAVNSAARLLAKLDAHLARHLEAQPSPLERHLAEHYVEAEATELNGDGE